MTILSILLSGLWDRNYGIPRGRSKQELLQPAPTSGTSSSKEGENRFLCFLFCLFVCLLVFPLHLITPLSFGSPFLGKATAASGVALPIRVNVCDVSGFIRLVMHREGFSFKIAKLRKTGTTLLRFPTA